MDGKSYVELAKQVANSVRSAAVGGKLHNEQQVKDAALIATLPIIKTLESALQILVLSTNPKAIDEMPTLQGVITFEDHARFAAQAALAHDVLAILGHLGKWVASKCGDCGALRLLDVNNRCPACLATLDERPWGIWFLGNGSSLHEGDKDDEAGWCVFDGKCEFFPTPEEAHKKCVNYWEWHGGKSKYEVRSRLTGLQPVLLSEQAVHPAVTFVETVLHELDEEAKIKATLELLE